MSATKATRKPIDISKGTKTTVLNNLQNTCEGVAFTLNASI